MPWEHASNDSYNTLCKTVTRVNGHHLLASKFIGSLQGRAIWCTKCAYSWRKVRPLWEECKGPTTTGLQAQRGCARPGWFQGTGGLREERITEGRSLSRSQVIWLRKQTGQKVAARVTARGGPYIGPLQKPTDISRNELLKCYGINSDKRAFIQWFVREWGPLRKTHADGEESDEPDEDVLA